MRELGMLKKKKKTFVKQERKYLKESLAIVKCNPDSNASMATGPSQA